LARMSCQISLKQGNYPCRRPPPCVFVVLSRLGQQAWSRHLDCYAPKVVPE
jgi:hypothetical protein